MRPILKGLIEARPEGYNRIKNNLHIFKGKFNPDVTHHGNIYAPRVITYTGNEESALLMAQFEFVAWNINILRDPVFEEVTKRTNDLVSWQLEHCAEQVWVLFSLLQLRVIIMVRIRVKVEIQGQSLAENELNHS